MTHYNDVTVRFNGEPLCTAESVTVSDAPDAQEPLPPSHATFRCTADLSAIGAMFDTVRLPPSQPRGYVTIPYGILGPLRLEGSVDLPSWQVTETGAKGAFRMAENEMRRAVSMAVQNAYTPGGWCDVTLRANAHPDPKVRELVRALNGGRYRHYRKRQKAMRRLLRAAGILVGGQ